MTHAHEITHEQRLRAYPLGLCRLHVTLLDACYITYGKYLFMVTSLVFLFYFVECNLDFKIQMVSRHYTFEALKTHKEP